MEQDNLINYLYRRLKNEHLWFVTKTNNNGSYWQTKPAKYYDLDEYGELKNKSKVEKEINEYLGDGAETISEAVSLFIADNVINGSISQTDYLIMDYKDKPVDYSENAVEVKNVEPKYIEPQITGSNKQVESKQLNEIASKVPGTEVEKKPEIEYEELTLDDIEGSMSEEVAALYEKLGIDIDETWENVQNDMEYGYLQLATINGKTYIVYDDGETQAYCSGRDSNNIPLVFIEDIKDLIKDKKQEDIFDDVTNGEAVYGVYDDKDIRNYKDRYKEPTYAKRNKIRNFKDDKFKQKSVRDIINKGVTHVDYEKMPNERVQDYKNSKKEESSDVLSYVVEYELKDGTKGKVTVNDVNNAQDMKETLIKTLRDMGYYRTAGQTLKSYKYKLVNKDTLKEVKIEDTQRKLEESDSITFYDKSPEYYEFKLSGINGVFEYRDYNGGDVDGWVYDNEDANCTAIITSKKNEVDFIREHFGSLENTLKQNNMTLDRFNKLPDLIIVIHDDENIKWYSYKDIISEDANYEVTLQISGQYNKKVRANNRDKAIEQVEIEINKPNFDLNKLQNVEIISHNAILEESKNIEKHKKIENVQRKLEDDNFGKFKVLDLTDEIRNTLDKSNESEKVITTNNGFYDLEQKGYSGYGTWLGYEHGKWSSNKKMNSYIRSIIPVVKKVMIKALNNKNFTESDIVVDDFIYESDMIRLYIIDEKSKKTENVQRRLEEENNKSLNLISDMFKSKDFDSDSKAGQIVMRTSNLFNVLSDKGYDVQVSFDNGESTNTILLGQQGGSILITINNTNQPLRAFTDGSFEITEDNIKTLEDIRKEITTL